MLLYVLNMFVYGSLLDKKLRLNVLGREIEGKLDTLENYILELLI